MNANNLSTNMNTNLEKPLLILDMDECLLHATAQPLGDQPPHFTYKQLHVYIRPHLNEFLDTVSKHYRLAIWSTGTDQYVQYLIHQSKPDAVTFDFIWGRSKCRKVKDDFFGYAHYYKALDKLKKYGYLLDEIIMIDDTPSKIISNHATTISIDSFYGSTDDRALLDIMQALPLITATIKK